MLFLLRKKSEYITLNERSNDNEKTITNTDFYTSFFGYSESRSDKSR